mmetsp:Transcript_29759/g.69186  ORF Transcript_29759/g.69186 Transcript_29759/m.69186 type:complete len:332 (+) Transcript_29759:33-1028(+)
MQRNKHLPTCKPCLSTTNSGHLAELGTSAALQRAISDALFSACVLGGSNNGGILCDLSPLGEHLVRCHSALLIVAQLLPQLSLNRLFRREEEDFEPRVFQSLLCSGSFAGVNLHEVGHQPLGLHGDFAKLFGIKLPLTAADALVQDLHVPTVVVKGWQRAKDDVEHDAHGPHVHLLAVGVSGRPLSPASVNHLGCEVVRGPAESAAHGGLGSEALHGRQLRVHSLGHIGGIRAKLHRQAEVCDFGNHVIAAGGSQQHVLRLQITVHYLLRVQVSHSAEEVSEEPAALQLRKGALVEEVVQEVTTLAQLHDQVHVPLVFKNFKEPERVGVVH